MNLLPDDPMASQNALPNRIDVRCVLDQRKGGLESPCQRLGVNCREPQAVLSGWSRGNAAKLDQDVGRQRTRSLMIGSRLQGVKHWERSALGVNLPLQGRPT